MANGIGSSSVRVDRSEMATTSIAWPGTEIVRPGGSRARGFPGWCRDFACSLHVHWSGSDSVLGLRSMSEGGHRGRRSFVRETAATYRQVGRGPVLHPVLRQSGQLSAADAVSSAGCSDFSSRNGPHTRVSMPVRMKHRYVPGRADDGLSAHVHAGVDQDRSRLLFELTSRSW